MSDLKTLQREWIAHLAKELGLSLTALARKAGVHDSTLTRFMNNADADYALSNRTIEAIAQTFGVSFGQPVPHINVYENLPEVSTTWRYDEVEPVLLETIEDLTTRTVVEAGLSDQIEAWFLRTNRLLLAGCLAHDVFLISRSTAPQPQDVVIVQLETARRNEPKHLARIYLPPFLMTATVNPTANMPELLDSRRMRIIGTVITVVRAHRSRPQHEFQNISVQVI